MNYTSFPLTFFKEKHKKNTQTFVRALIRFKKENILLIKMLHFMNDIIVTREYFFKSILITIFEYKVI